MGSTKQEIIEKYGEEYYEQKKEYQRQYEKSHKKERNAYKSRRRAEKTKERFGEVVDLDGEIWKVIEGTNNEYAISNKGRGKAFHYNHTNLEKLLKPSKVSPNSKYYRFAINRYGKHMSCKIHRLVAEAFIPNPNNFPQVNHKDEDPSNNCVENLEWCDSKYNNSYGTKIERQSEGKKKPVIGYFNETDFYKIWFRSSADAAEILTGNRKASTSITAVISGRQNTYKKLKWKYERDI